MFARNANPTGRGRGTAAKKLAAPVKGSKGKATKQEDRSALIDISNASKNIEDGDKKVTGPSKPKNKSNVPLVESKLPRAAIVRGKEKVEKEKAVAAETLVQTTSSQESRVKEELTHEEEGMSFLEASGTLAETEETLLDFDRENKDDVFFVGSYAKDIFDYYKRRESMFKIPHYMGTKQCHITVHMRAILVDWLAEIQENFELNHETLYLAVKLTDLYLSRVEVDKELLQLLGSAAVFIACKFDERCPPMIDDFTYICDNSFNRSEFIDMEMEVLRKVDFELGIPISYRFLRRYAKVGRISIETLTLARFILEMSLMEYDLVKEKDSMIAAAALYIAMKMRSEGTWEGDVVKGCGYQLEELKPFIIKLNDMLLAPPSDDLNSIRSKYSHPVFHSVSELKPLPTSQLL